MSPRRIVWWWNDWRGDPAIRASSGAARSLWLTMLEIADQCKPRGFVLLDGKPVSAAVLADRHGGGMTEQQAAELLAELERNGVYNVATDGTIYCRRMRREQTKGSPTRALRQRRYRERKKRPRLVYSRDG